MQYIKICQFIIGCLLMACVVKIVVCLEASGTNGLNRQKWPELMVLANYRIKFLSQFFECTASSSDCYFAHCSICRILRSKFQHDFSLF